MARQSLQAELEGYLKLAESKARKEMAKTYQQEIIFHVDDFTDSLFKSWNSQGTKAAGVAGWTPDKISKNQAKNMKIAFDKGSQEIIDTLYKSLQNLRYKTGAPGVPSSYVALSKLIVSRFGGPQWKGLVVYMISPTVFNFESPQFQGAVTRAKTKGLNTINKELKKLGLRKLTEGKGGAGGDIWGHHGGITGSDPKSTYGLAGITKAVESKAHINEDDYDPVVDEGGKLDSYADIFWKRLGDELEAKGYWDAKQHTRRPSGKRPGNMNDTHIMRIVFGHKSLNIMRGYDKQGGKANWTKLGPVLRKLLEAVRTNVEKDIVKQFIEDGKKAPDMSGSETPRTRLGKLGAESIVLSFVRNIKKGGKKSIKVKSKTDPVKKSGIVTHKLQGKGKGKGKNPISTRKGSRDPVKAKAGVAKKGQTRSGRTAAMNPIGLVALLNKSLPAQVQRNMAPLKGSFPRRLTYRTGGFAQSAQVTNVAPFSKMVEIQYTYEKDPYAVFERGSGDPRATGPARDPVQIIGESIREIAQLIMGTRFGLVRTKRV